MTLQILISTLGAGGIVRVADMLPVPSDNVSYLVSWQEPSGITPDELKREDVTVVTMPGRGLSRNRNNALTHATGDILLIADDDVEYDTGSFDKIINFFESHPDADAATFIVSRPTTCVYPDVETVLRRQHYPRGYYVCSFELALRRSTTGDFRFDERFGLGCKKFGSGEEELFVDTLLRANKRVIFNPLVIACHPDRSTGLTGQSTPAVQRASGAVICRLYGVSALPRLVLKALRMNKEGGGNLLKVMWYVLSGGINTLFMKW